MTIGVVRPNAAERAPSTWRTMLALGRVSNLPTVWTNATAGVFLSGAEPTVALVVSTALSLSLFYTGGMFLNDAFDREIDARERPTRPIPAGHVSARTVFAIGFGLLAAGGIIVALVSPSAHALGCAALLASAIVLYDAWHKGNPVSPVLMASCRALAYLTAGVAARETGIVGPTWLVPGAVIGFAYVVLLTWAAKRVGDRAVALLIAGIALLDAALVASTGALLPAFVVALGFPLTLRLQRWVRGT